MTYRDQINEKAVQLLTELRGKFDTESEIRKVLTATVRLLGKLREVRSTENSSVEH